MINLRALAVQPPPLKESITPGNQEDKTRLVVMGLQSSVEQYVRRWVRMNLNEVELNERFRMLGSETQRILTENGISCLEVKGILAEQFERNR